MAEEFPVVFAIYPHVTQLDFTGPHEVLARLPGAQCILASSTGGDLDWSAPGAFTGAFEAALSALSPGQLSEPVRTEFGWHLIELLETREHDDTEDQRRNLAYQELRKQKAELENERWERQLRDEAYVEIRL